MLSLLKKALTKTRSALSNRIRSLFGRGLSDETFEELEQILYEADIGSELATAFTDRIRDFVKKSKTSDATAILSEMEQFATEILSEPPGIEEPETGHPEVILMVGVNGSGKTTSAAKLAKQYQDRGKKVLLAAGDTFRAAAIEQLEIWANRLGIDIVKGRAGGDSSAVIYDAIAKAQAKGYDVVIADTAGRLQDKTDLMHELEKVGRVAKKLSPKAPHQTLLVIDATTGQNAVDQAKIFNEFTPLTGIVLTKLDGTAKGGIILSIYRQMGLPVRYIGIGESVKDLAPFEVESYVEALFAK